MWQVVKHRIRPTHLLRDAFGGLTLIASTDNGVEWYFTLEVEEVERYGLAQAIQLAIERHNLAQERVIEDIPVELQQEYELKLGISSKTENAASGLITYESYLEEAIMLMEAVIDHENTIKQLKAEIASLKQALGRA